MSKQQEITACAFLYNDEGRLFVAKRAATKKFLPNKFELIGGHTEFGETLQESLVREAREEVGIALIVERPFHAFTYVSSDGRTHTVEVDFFARLADASRLPKLNPEEHSESAWITLDEVDQYFDPDDDERTAILEGFRQLPSSPRW